MQQRGRGGSVTVGEIGGCTILILEKARMVNKLSDPAWCAPLSLYPRYVSQFAQTQFTTTEPFTKSGLVLDIHNSVEYSAKEGSEFGNGAMGDPNHSLACLS